MNRIVMFAALVGVTAALPLEAQSRGQSQSRSQTQGRGSIAVPPGQWPSAGRCRIWIDGLPTNRQPNETDCVTARRTVPANGRVLEGASTSSGNRDDRYGRSDRYGRDDDDRDDRNGGNDDDDRSTRRFIDRNGLECEEKAVTKNGKRSYDLNRDGRCDSGTGRGYPTTLPDMIGAIVYGQGQRTANVSRWLGTDRYQVRYTDQNHDRRPERVRWLDGAGSLLQERMDTNRDGRADIVNVYSAGRLVQSIGGR